MNTIPNWFKEIHQQLPLSRGKEDFHAFMDKLLRQKFLFPLKGMNKSDFTSFFETTLNFEKVKEVQERSVNKILKAIEFYYDGTPYHAYKELDKTIRNDEKDYYKIIKKNNYESGNNFYRLRLQEGNVPLSKKEMFHVPFEKRGKVATQRFSIPGFPSLYLGKTLYLCWEEMNRPELNKFQAVRLKNKSPIKYLDLVPPSLEEGMDKRALYKYLILFPLLAACYVKVEEPSDHFKPEYIIPQLLLQWVRNNGDVDGIEYKSTNLGKKQFHQKGGLTNFVFPVQKIGKTGHCPDLKSMFSITEAISWQLKELESGGGNYIYDNAGDRYIDNKLPKIEFIKGRKTPYSTTVLGDLERLLDSMPDEKLQ